MRISDWSSDVCSSDLFAQRPEAESLAAANKRIANLLKKADSALGAVDHAKLAEPAEQALADVIVKLKPQAQAQLAQGDFTGSLDTMAQARSEEHTSELQALMSISYDIHCLTIKTKNT